MNHDKISYTGTVRVSVQKDNKIISTRVYHNKGTKYLYEFLCYCLSGSYDRVKNKKPFKIKLYNLAGTEYHTDLEPNVDGSAEATTFVSIDQKGEVLPTEKDDDNQPINYKTVLHFLIPYAFIAQDEIHQICLYGANATRNDEYAAYYFLTNEAGDDWEPIRITNTTSSAYNLIIEWELSFNLD